MRKRYNHSKYGNFASVNKFFRESPIAPSAFSKFEGAGIIGKAISMVGEKLIATPLHKITYSAVGTVYNRKKSTPYIGSILYTVFKWGLLLILATYQPILFIMILVGICYMIYKVFK